MALIAMAVWDTDSNERWKLTAQTLASLSDTVDFEKHRLIVVDNGSCEMSKETTRTWQNLINNRYSEYISIGLDIPVEIITLEENIGTARAINKAWLKRRPNENAVKMDNDVVVYQKDWVDKLEECIAREPTLGIIGLKRKDCIETPWHEASWYRSTLRMLPHELGQTWLIVEEVHHVMGICQMYSAACLEKIGYLYQMGALYGFDDALASVRARKAGFFTAHYPHIEIENLDPGDNDYTMWKNVYSGALMDRFNATKRAIELGHLPVYFGPEDL